MSILKHKPNNAQNQNRKVRNVIDNRNITRATNIKQIRIDNVLVWNGTSW